MREIIKRGTSSKKVIEDFLKECNLQESEMKIVVEHKGSKGFLSLFGKKEAVVKFILPKVQDRIERYLKTLLKHLNVSYQEIEITQKKNTYFTHIKGVDNPGFLIGKEGKMLESIEILLNKIVDDKEHKDDNVVLNIDSYKKRNSNSNEGGKPKTFPKNVSPQKQKKKMPTNIKGRKKPIRRQPREKV